MKAYHDPIGAGEFQAVDHVLKSHDPTIAYHRNIKLSLNQADDVSVGLANFLLILLLRSAVHSEHRAARILYF